MICPYLTRTVAVLLFLLFGLRGGATVEIIRDPGWGKGEVVERYTIGPGMVYTFYYYKDKPLRLWCVEVDISNPWVRLEEAESNDQVPHVARWTVPQFSRQNSRPGHQVKAAVNHDFFSYDDGISIATNVSQGEMTHYLNGRCMLGISKDGTAGVFKAFDRKTYESRFITACTAPDGTSVAIESYNSGAISGMVGDVIMFNRMNSRTLRDDKGTYIGLQALDEWLFNGPDIRCKVVGISSHPIATSRGTSVLFLRNAATDAFKGHLTVGDTMIVAQRIENPFWGEAPKNIYAGFHGYPSLVHDGKFHDGEYNDFENGREYQKASRTMVGLSRDKRKVYMVVTEASDASAPVDCVELACWLVKHGSWDVINLDSGGSSAMVVDHEMKNLPGRPKEGIRAVKTAMLAVSTAPEDKQVVRIAFNKPQLTIASLKEEALNVMSFNQYDEVIDRRLDLCEYQVIPTSLGHVDVTGRFHAMEEGTGIIRVKKDGLTAEIKVKVNRP